MALDKYCLVLNTILILWKYYDVPLRVIVSYIQDSVKIDMGSFQLFQNKPNFDFS